MSLLQVTDLKVEYTTSRGTLRAVDGVSFSLERGKTLGIVGESGCGKSTLMKSLMRLLPPQGRIVGGQVLLEGTDLTKLSEHELRAIRWKKMALITQSAMNALNPVYKIGDQLAEVLIVHGGMTRKAAWERAAQLCQLVGIDPARLSAYPHQLSGGMRQRVMIAMAIALNPALIIADEPTTALDVVIQHRILTRIRELQSQLQIAMILVTHDISLVAEICDYAMVMYAGEMVEYGAVRDIFFKAYHPYTLGLLNAVPSVTQDIESLISIPGYPPDLIHPPAGCRFATRCPFRTEVCETQRPNLGEVQAGHRVGCHFPEKAEEFRRQAADRRTWERMSV